MRDISTLSRSQVSQDIKSHPSSNGGPPNAEPDDGARDDSDPPKLERPGYPGIRQAAERLEGNQLRLWLLYRDLWSSEAEGAWIKDQKAAEELDLSQRTVERARKFLAQRGWIRQKWDSNGSGRFLRKWARVPPESTEANPEDGGGEPDNRGGRVPTAGSGGSRQQGRAGPDSRDGEVEGSIPRGTTQGKKTCGYTRTHGGELETADKSEDSAGGNPAEIPVEQSAETADSAHRADGRPSAGEPVAETAAGEPILLAKDDNGEPMVVVEGTDRAATYLPPRTSAEDVQQDPELARTLASLPAEIGPHPEGGVVKVGVSKAGPYVLHQPPAGSGRSPVYKDIPGNHAEPWTFDLGRLVQFLAVENPEVLRGYYGYSAESNHSDQVRERLGLD